MTDSRQQTDEALRQRHAEHRSRTEELTRSDHIEAGGELRIIELDKDVNALCQRHGEAARYPIAVEHDVKPIAASSLPVRPSEGLAPLESISQQSARCQASWRLGARAIYVLTQPCR